MGVPLNKHPGFVRKLDGEHIFVQLRAGGQVRCRNKGFELGNRVAIIFDIGHKKVIDIYSLEEATIAVKRGSCPIFDAAVRKPEWIPDNEEVIYYGDDDYPDDAYGNPWSHRVCD